MVLREISSKSLNLESFNRRIGPAKHAGLPSAFLLPLPRSAGPSPSCTASMRQSAGTPTWVRGRVAAAACTAHTAQPRPSILTPTLLSQAAPSPSWSSTPPRAAPAPQHWGATWRRGSGCSTWCRRIPGLARRRPPAPSGRWWAAPWRQVGEQLQRHWRGRAGGACAHAECALASACCNPPSPVLCMYAALQGSCSTRLRWAGGSSCWPTSQPPQHGSSGSWRDVLACMLGGQSGLAAAAATS